MLGRRASRHATAVLNDVILRGRVGGFPLIATDGFEYSVGVSERLFGSACVSGHVLKTRRNDSRRPSRTAPEDRHGGSAEGCAVAPGVELLGNSNDRASRCDEFINPRFAEVAGCTEPNRGSGAGWKTTYDRAAGILAGLSAGYRFGGRLRVEAEWFHRESEYDQT